MVAYSFQKRFAPQIVAGTKRQTIRGHRKRHARQGEALQLYQGMRTKYCKKIISDPICTSVENIALMVPSGLVGVCQVSTPTGFTEISDAFAVCDGFEDAKDFTSFWQKSHGDGPFEGVTVMWLPTPDSIH